MIEQTDLEDIYSLQFVQWTIPLFCVNILEHLLPCMKQCDEQLILNGLDLLHHVTELLDESLLTSALWTDSSSAARELVSFFLNQSYCKLNLFWYLLKLLLQ